MVPVEFEAVLGLRSRSGQSYAGRQRSLLIRNRTLAPSLHIFSRRPILDIPPFRRPRPAFGSPGLDSPTRVSLFDGRPNFTRFVPDPTGPRPRGTGSFESRERQISSPIRWFWNHI